MTEEDTFRVLSRIPADDMHGYYMAWIDDSDDTATFEEVCSRHGWNADDFKYWINKVA